MAADSDRVSDPARRLRDHLFHDELRIGASISITVVLAAVIGLGAGLATLAPYRRDYQAVHAGAGQSFEVVGLAQPESAS